jgi:hypothetical protein
MTSLVQSARHEHHRGQRATRTIHREHRQCIAQMARVLWPPVAREALGSLPEGLASGMEEDAKKAVAPSNRPVGQL